MAYFIVIGTDNDVKGVVDEIKTSHLQHNVVTSGCIISEGDDLYYHWDVFNEKGDKTSENKDSIVLHDALTNQIAQFKALIPNANVVPNVFIVAKCFNEKDSEVVQMVCDELSEIGGAQLSSLQVDIVLVGYDLNKPNDVTIRPHWRILESLQGLCDNRRFPTKILYVNNMDYKGAATNIDSRMLGRFLCHWSKVVCSGGYNPKNTVQSKVYAIGVAEYQYDFRDLNEFFKLSAEVMMLNRKLDAEPSPETQALLDKNDFKHINLDLEWLDGMQSIKSKWSSYCTTEWDPSKPLSDNPDSVARHELELASYLNSFLKLYIAQERKEIDNITSTVEQKRVEIGVLNAALSNSTDVAQYALAKASIAELEAQIEELQEQIELHKNNIRKNSFKDADELHRSFSELDPITQADEDNYNDYLGSINQFLSYVKSDEGLEKMREAVERATNSDYVPQSYPTHAVQNVGRVYAIGEPSVQMPESPTAAVTANDAENRIGCLGWILGLFGAKQDNTQIPVLTSDPVDHDRSMSLISALDVCHKALKKADAVRAWWTKLCGEIDTLDNRRKECQSLMDGVLTPSGGYEAGKEGYKPARHSKSISLIDMDKVRKFRDHDNYYAEMIARFLDRYFDKDRTMTLLELIKHQVLDPLVGRFHTLKWDGSNPFVKENITDEEMHEYVTNNIKQSKPFVEYVHVGDHNICDKVQGLFFSNNPNIPQISPQFRNQYQIGWNKINPVFVKDFVNSLCVIQVMDIPKHIDTLKDFKPCRDTKLSRMRANIANETCDIVRNASTVEQKARAIYDWICSNIVYDSTKQIRDAEACWRTKRGVCLAYCELFCYMTESVGLTAEIIIGKTKNRRGEIADEKHAWIFLYTDGYNGIFIDPTWGAGAETEIEPDKDANRSMWFDISPYWLIFTHYPDDERWTKLDISVSEGQFAKLSAILPSAESDGKNVLHNMLR